MNSACLVKHILKLKSFVDVYRKDFDCRVLLSILLILVLYSNSKRSVTSQQPPNKKISFDKDCGSTKGCFPDCPDGCDYLVTWQRQPSDDSVKFSISMALDNTNNIWIAAGLSRTGEMASHVLLLVY